MWSYLIDEYWEKFSTYTIKSILPNGTVHVVGFYDMYADLANEFNKDKAYLKMSQDETPKGVFDSYIENITLKILDESYVLRYMIMRYMTYKLYRYYENPRMGAPEFVCYDKNRKSVVTIPSGMWRWWVDEMNY